MAGKEGEGEEVFGVMEWVRVSGFVVSRVQDEWGIGGNGERADGVESRKGCLGLNNVRTE